MRNFKYRGKRPDLVRPPHEVFKKIDMKGGDPHQCWPWQGTLGWRNNPIHYVFCKRVNARRLVYSLKNGMHYDAVPRLVMLCRNPICCNPNHMAPSKMEKLLRVDK
jgi:hypothetical protein